MTHSGNAVTGQAEGIWSKALPQVVDEPVVVKERQ